MTDNRLNDLVGLARQGDREAFAEIVLLMQQRIFGYCYPMIGNRQDAEDLVQEVFVRAYQHMEKYEEGGNFAAWLFTIAHRLCLNKIKKKSRLLALVHKIANEEAVRPKHEKMDESNESNEAILTLLHALNPKQRGLVILRVIHEMSYEEISGIVGVSPVSLRKQYERARKQLQRENGGSTKEMNRRMNYEHL